MGKALRMLLIVFIAYLLQTSLMPSFQIYGVIPDLLAVVLVAIAADEDIFTSLCMGAVAALLMDTMVGMVSVLYLVTYPLMAYAAARLTLFLDEHLPIRSKLLLPLVCAAVVAMREVAMLIYLYLNGVDLIAGAFIRALTCTLYTMALALPGKWLVDWGLTVRRKRIKEPPEPRKGGVK